MFLEAWEALRRQHRGQDSSVAAALSASLDLTQPKPPPLEMPGVCCQALWPACPTGPGQESSCAPLPTQEPQAALGSPGTPCCPTFAAALLCVCFCGRAQAPPRPGGVIAPRLPAAGVSEQCVKWRSGTPPWDSHSSLSARALSGVDSAAWPPQLGVAVGVWGGGAGADGIRAWVQGAGIGDSRGGRREGQGLGESG